MISIIVPTLNEEKHITQIIRYIHENTANGTEAELIVVDGCSTDRTLVIARHLGVYGIEAQRGRATQMNFGASISTGDILFFLHADTFPPPNFLKDIKQAVDEGYSAGCYRLSFDHHHWFLRLNCWFTRFNFTPFRFGDQGLFVRKQLFETIGGFNSKMMVLEDQELVKRIKRVANFTVFKRAVITSARKYLANGIFRLQFIFILIYFLYKIGLSQKILIGICNRLVREPVSRFDLSSTVFRER